MTSEEKKHVIKNINAITRLELSKKIAVEYGPENASNPPMVGDFSVHEMAGLLQKVLIYLENETEKNWKLLPFHDLPNNATIALYLQQIETCIHTRKPMHAWLDPLIKLVHYEMRNGFWDRPAKTTADEINAFRREAQEFTARLSATLEEAEKLREQLVLQNKDFAKNNASVTTLYKNLSRNREEVELLFHKMQSTEGQSAITISQANAFLHKMEEELKESNLNTERERIKVIEQLAETQLLKDEIVGQVSSFEESRNLFNGVISSAQEKEARLLEQEQRLARLQGLQADETLGRVFNQREARLASSVRNWTAISAVATILTVGWVFVVFSKYDTSLPGGINWLMLLGNLVRTSPAFVFLYFCLSQFTKERNIQEEYAFKAAVSMTITAYSDMVDGDEKTKMLISTVQGVYTPPVLGKVFKPFSLRSKHLVETSKTAAEAIRDVKDIVKAVRGEDDKKKSGE